MTKDEALVAVEKVTALQLESAGLMSDDSDKADSRISAIGAEIEDLVVRIINAANEMSVEDRTKIMSALDGSEAEHEAMRAYIADERAPINEDW